MRTITVIAIFCVLFLVLATPGLAVETTKVTTAQIKDPKLTASAVKAVLPDLVVESARVTGAPVIIDATKTVLLPLEITVKNTGTAVATNFNVGAQGNAEDGNVYGYWYVVPGEQVMKDREGVVVASLPVGGTKTFNGFLMMTAQPVNEAMNPGTTYEVTAMVDFNLDPDSGTYEWGVKEISDTNNNKIISYP